MNSFLPDELKLNSFELLNSSIQMSFSLSSNLARFYFEWAWMKSSSSQARADSSFKEWQEDGGGEGQPANRKEILK